MASGERMRKYSFVALRCCFVSVIFVLTACQSDEEKLQRLQGDQAVHCLLVEKYREDYDLARKADHDANVARSDHTDSLLREWGDRKAKCDLATRELNRFMR